MAMMTLAVMMITRYVLIFTGATGVAGKAGATGATGSVKAVQSTTVRPSPSCVGPVGESYDTRTD